MSALLLALACGDDPTGDRPPPPPMDSAPPTAPRTATGETGSTGATGDTGAPPEPGPCGVLASAAAVGGADHESTQCLAVGADDALFVGGFFVGALPFDPGGPSETTLVSTGASDGLVVKYAPDGAFTWARHLATTTSTWSEALAPTADGGVVAVGAFYGTNTFAHGQPDAVVRESAGEADAFVARFDPAGGLAWVAVFGGPAHDFALDVAVLADDAVLVVGIYRGDLTLAAGLPEETVLALHPYAFESGFVARLEADGRLAWARAFGGTTYARADAAELDPVSGELVVAGTLSGAGVATFPGTAQAIDPVGASGYVARWDPASGDAGAIVTFGGFPSAIDVAPDGGVVVAGDFAGDAVFGAGEPAETTLSSVANTDAFVARFDPAGALTWAAQSASEPWTNTAGRGVAATPDGGAVLIGDFTGRARFGAGEPAERELATLGSYDLYVARFDAAGGFGCVAHVGGGEVELGAAVARRADGRFTTAGEFHARATVAVGAPEEIELVGGGASDGLLVDWTF